MSKSKKINILKNAKKTKIVLSEKLADVTDINIADCKLELKFNREIIIEGCKGVNDYSEDRICVNVKKGIIVIEGTKLTLCSFDDNCAVIKGVFSNIGFEV